MNSGRRTVDGVTQSRCEPSEGLDRLGDPVADRAMHEATQGSPSVARDVLRTVAHAPADAWPAPLRALLDTFPEPSPSGQRQLAEQFFAEHGPEIMLCLCCSSLAHDYLNPRGAQILLQSGPLVKDVPRRLGTTAQMLMDCFAPGGLVAHGEGHVRLTRVRIIHAAVRVLAGSTMSDPINQEDLAYAYSSFTWPVIHGLRRLGVRVHTEHVDAYLAHWRVMGELLGVLPQLLPANEEEARSQYERLSEHRSSSSAAGKSLAAALVATVDRYLPEQSPVSGADLIQFFLGTASARALGLSVPTGGARFRKWLIFGAVRTGLARPWVRELAANAVLKLCQEGGLEIPARIFGAWYPKRQIPADLTAHQEGSVQYV
jgi:hypothetical protein